ncbi:hypothetical protein M408DRAFT_7271 [Serendipita vermifera MAFF 305830]|uniref:Uncharacterized protein n=1 Tax=Serendipita vermifera MAFF 305830 TaxID=933852 RepID=A0A0C3B1N9_SERVB|nr:hypothetical protein M408DRAFT_7271 [Serendipita vermifera MAFF 305830]
MNSLSLTNSPNKRPLLATGSNGITRSNGVSSLDGIFETSSSEDESQSHLDAGTNPADSSTVSSVSSSSSPSEEEGPNSPLYSSDHTVRSRAPPNTPKKTSSNASVETSPNGSGEDNEDANGSISSTGSGLSRKLGDKLQNHTSPSTSQRTLRALSNDLERPPRVDVGAGKGRGRGRAGVHTREWHKRGWRENTVRERRRKELLEELAQLEREADSSAVASSTNGSGAPGWKKKRRGTGPSKYYYDEDANWVAVDGGIEIRPEMAVGFHNESSMSEADHTWDAPRPKFLTKLFK